MKNSCLRVVLSATPKIVLDQEPAIALDQFHRSEDVDIFGESNFIIFVDDCPCDWQLVSLIVQNPPVTTFWPYEPEVWVMAAKRMENAEIDGFAHPEIFTINCEEFLMFGDPIWFSLCRVTGRDSDGWTESEEVRYEVTHPGSTMHFEFPLLSQYDLAVLERLTGVETTYAYA